MTVKDYYNKTQVVTDKLDSFSNLYQFLNFLEEFHKKNDHIVKSINIELNINYI